MTVCRTTVLLGALLIFCGGTGLAGAQDDSITKAVLVPNTEENPRNGEGDMIQLKDGTLLFAWTRFMKGSGDFSPAEIAAITSTDGGRTWSEPYVLQPNVGQTNTMEVSFLRLVSGEILFQYCIKDSEKTCQAWVRWSSDEAKTWSEPVLTTNFGGYIATNNDRLIQLRTGRILIPVYGGWPGTIWSCCVYSDDDGRSWTKGADVWVEPTRYGADEPAVVELRDGRVMMVIRTALGRIYKAYSSDGGATFGAPDTMPLVSPNSPASIARVPSTGDLVIVWNNSSSERYPLTTAISKDDGLTWANYRVLEPGPGSFCYTSLDFVDDRALLTYYAPDGLRLAAIPVPWFYAPEPLTVWRWEGAVSGVQDAWDLANNASVCLQDLPDRWQGALDSEVTVRARVVSTIEGATATAMLWVGSAVPGDSCALYLRRGPQTDQVSFSQDFADAVDLPDAGQFHAYRVKTDHAAKTAEVFVDDAAQPALTAPLSTTMGLYDMNRLLVGDPRADFLGGESQWRELRWRNGSDGEWSRPVSRKKGSMTMVLGRAGVLPVMIAVMLGGAFMAQAQTDGVTKMALVSPTEDSPRNGEGDMIQLKDGTLFFAWTRFLKGGSDFSPAEIAAMVSVDGGKTWSAPYVLQKNEGQTNTMEVSLLRLKNGEILFQYCIKDSEKKCRAWVRWSDDEAKTWSEPVLATDFEGYVATNNNRMIQLTSGRILIAAYNGWPGTIYSMCAYSDDNGRTWKKGADVWVEKTGYGADEPAVIELKDGRVMMIIRTDKGRMYRAYSSDGGETFTEPEATTVVSPNGPASIARIPSTGDLLLVWTESPTERWPLRTAISRNDGRTWSHKRTLEGTPGGYCYTSITFVDDKCLMTYYSTDGLRLTTVPVSWFYGKD